MKKKGVIVLCHASDGKWGVSTFDSRGVWRGGVSNLTRSGAQKEARRLKAIYRRKGTLISLKQFRMED